MTVSSTARRLSHPNAMELIEVLEDQQYLYTVASLCTAFPCPCTAVFHCLSWPSPSFQLPSKALEDQQYLSTQ